LYIYNDPLAFEMKIQFHFSMIYGDRTLDFAVTRCGGSVPSLQDVPSLRVLTSSSTRMAYKHSRNTEQVGCLPKGWFFFCPSLCCWCQHDTDATKHVLIFMVILCSSSQSTILWE